MRTHESRCCWIALPLWIGHSGACGPVIMYSPIRVAYLGIAEPVCMQAVAVKELVYFCAHLSLQLHDDTESSRLQATCLSCLAECFRIFDAGHRYLSAAAVERATYLGNLFATSYVKLASDALSARCCLWKVRPKLHDWQEIISRLSVDPTNPNYKDCLNDESMLLIFKTVTRACHPRSAPLRVALRYLGQLMLQIDATENTLA